MDAQQRSQAGGNEPGEVAGQWEGRGGPAREADIPEVRPKPNPKVGHTGGAALNLTLEDPI